MARLLLLRVYGWPGAVYLAVKVATGKTMMRGVARYAEPPEGRRFCAAVAWALESVDTPSSPRQGFEGVLEHVVVQFIAKCSRVCSHELVRHRLASYAQSTTRPTQAPGLRVLVDRLCDGDAVAARELCPSAPGGARDACLSYYTRICGASPGEVDRRLRYLQPHSVQTHIMATMNLREVLHVLALRLHPKAHWEIRSLAWSLAHRLWASYRVPARLMILLKRPGLAGVPGLRRGAREELGWIMSRCPGVRIDAPA